MKAEKQNEKKTLWHQIAAVLLALAVWQTAAMLLQQDLLLVSPVAVLLRLTTIWREPGFFSAISVSALRIISGFLWGLLAAGLLGIAAGRFRLIEILLRPYMVTVKSIPVASFIILALIWLSSAQLSSFISFLMVLPILYTAILSGIRNIDPQMLEMADVFHLSWRRRLLFLWIPQIKPYLLSGCSVALGLSWKAGIAAEIIGLPDGTIGEALYNSKIYLCTVDLFAWTVIIVLISVLFEKLFMALLRQIFAWEARL